MRGAMLGVRAAGVGLLAVLTTGCWLQPGFGPARQNYNPSESSLGVANVGLATEQWSAPLDPGVGGQPLVTATAVYTAGPVGSTFVVSATARGTGAALWRREFPVVDPTAHAERILSVANDTVLLLRVPPPGPVQVFEELDGATGATERSVRIDFLRVVPDSAVVSDDLIAFRGIQDLSVGKPGTVFAFTRDTLRLRWQSGSFIDQVGHDGDPLVIANGQLTMLGESATSPTAGVPSLHMFDLAACLTQGNNCTELRNAKLPLPAGASDTAFRTLAATEDGTVLLRRSWTDAGTPHADLVAMTRDGAVAYVVPLTALDGVAVAGNLVFATGVDAATPASSSSLLTFSGGNLVWRADVPDPLVGAPLVAGRVAYVQDGPANGHDLRAFEAAGCGATDCNAVDLIQMSGTAPLSGFSVTLGGVYASQGAPDNRLVSLRPPA